MKKPVQSLVVAGVLSATAAFAGQLTIIQADYTGGDVHRDMTSLLAAKVQGGQLALRVGNSTFGGVDPCFGKVKTLTVIYRNERGDFTVTAREGESLQLPSSQAIPIAPAAAVPALPTPVPPATVIPAAVSQNSPINQVPIPVATTPAPQINLPLSGQEFTTLNGDKYTNATVKMIEPDGIVVANTDGVRKLKFKNLLPEVGIKYGYDPGRAAQYQAVLNSNAIAAQKQAEQINAAASSVQAAKAAVQQQAGEKEQRFAAWMQELARQRAEAANTKKKDMFRFDNPEQEMANQRANAFETRINALRKQIAVLDQAGESTETTQRIIDAVYEKKIFIGMPVAFVRFSWGEPTDVNRSSNGTASSEQWVYRSRGEVKGSYVYLEEGVVSSIQN